MRLGGALWAESAVDFDTVCRVADLYGLSAITAPKGFAEWSDDACIAFGEKAASCGLLIGEAGYWDNMVDPDKERQTLHIRNVRTMLRKADLMQCRCVVTVVGSKDTAYGMLGVDPRNYGLEIRAEYRDVCLRIVDGLDLKITKYATEPWHNNFYHQPEDILEFLRSVGHPNVAFHLDMMNMVTQASYFETTALINKTFDMLARHIVSVHAKDVRIDPAHFFMKYDEVYPGDGVLDYTTFLTRLSLLHPDLPVFCEHYRNESDYAMAFARMHLLAERAGVRFARRQQITGRLRQ